MYRPLVSAGLRALLRPLALGSQSHTPAQSRAMSTDQSPDFTGAGSIGAVSAVRCMAQ